MEEKFCHPFPEVNYKKTTKKENTTEPYILIPKLMVLKRLKISVKTKTTESLQAHGFSTAINGFSPKKL
jgi:hypothetical protein